MLRWLAVSWLANAVVLGVTAWLLAGVHVNGSHWTLVWAALVFGVANTILKPVLKLVTLPLALLTFGVAWFFVSMLMLWVTVRLVHGFAIDGFRNYVLATVVVWLANLAVDALVRTGKRAL